MNVCVNMINKMIDGIIELNANILEFFDLATNLVSSKIQISSLRRLRNLQDENNGEININLEEEKKRINDLIEKASKLYYQITLDDIKSRIYNLNMATTENENDVSESEIQNILSHYKKLGKNEEKYVESFDRIAGQYTDQQLKVIIKSKIKLLKMMN